MECVTCVCVWLGAGGVGGGWVRGLGLGFTNPGGTVEKWDMCLCFGCGGVGGVGGMVGGFGQGLRGWGIWYLNVLLLPHYGVHHCKMSPESRLLLNPGLPGRSMMFFK